MYHYRTSLYTYICQVITSFEVFQHPIFCKACAFYISYVLQLLSPTSLSVIKYYTNYAYCSTGHCTTFFIFTVSTVRMSVVVRHQNFIWKESFKYLPGYLHWGFRSFYVLASTKCYKLVLRIGNKKLNNIILSLYMDELF